ncbi:helix-turn-helix transcriptional regulator [Sphingobacterium sp. DN00404]|uniref:Helix-turn-helix transcriptional regulator n=1 Tax=Sphingobacterium micropteri TaxID=2763501 RepID=A0ABR7YJS3_9SPHI|nr:helix-turn-helix domain-containing protein [Sphingobacterium micropteri]MBD1431559.1 helix-turn-helix transcriptional regulator [Sphingobacterium micropteri]
MDYADTKCEENLRALEDALYVLGGKWRLRILAAMFSGHKRFNDLQRTIHGISARVLSNELKQLELNGLLKREVHVDKTPVVTEYVSTEYARSIDNVIFTLADWGQKHKEKITTTCQNH